jgi:hypothetical protein
MCQKLLHMKCDERYVSGTRLDESTGAKLNAVGYKWICNSCTVTSSSISDSMSRFESILGELSAKVDGIESQISSLSKNQERESASKSVSSFASVLKSRNDSESVIVISSNNDSSELNRNVVIEKIENSINPEIAKISGVQNLSNKRVLLKSKVSDVGKLVDEMRDNLGTDYDVNIVEKKKPKLKIVGIDKDEDLNEEKLIKAIRAQNSFVTDEDSMKVVKMYDSARLKGCASIILEVDLRLHKLFSKERFMNIRWSRCRVFDATEIPRCFKCARYGHYEISCRNSVSCPKCAGDHRSADCNSERLQCINCVEANSKLKLKLNVKHSAGDRKCETMMKMLKQKIKSINRQ